MSIVKSGCTFIENNYISIFIIKLIYNQFQNFNLISFIIHYRHPKKGHSTKVGTVIQKVRHLSVHSPSNPLWPLWLSFHKLMLCALTFMHGKILFGFRILESCVYRKPCFQIALHLNYGSKSYISKKLCIQIVKIQRVFCVCRNNFYFALLIIKLCVELTLSVACQII
jgi:hypothetical protein